MSAAEVRSTVAERPGSFVGRAGELQALAARVERGARLTTLLGPPGVGKTRLALELARRLFGAGVFDAIAACDLVEARTPLELCASLARVLEVPLASAGEDEARRLVGSAIAHRGRALVLLDNFEQLVSAAPLVSAWLDAAPELQLVVTSRNPLGLAEEEVFDVSPLPTDGDGLSDAARLFVDRAAAAGGAAAALEPSVARQIAEKLDGIPLAIELAAARTALISPRQILERLDRGLFVLSGRADGRPAHQATMRETLAWSWGLLDDAAQRALARCSVFRGGFSQEAAEAVLEGLARPALELLEELIGHSLLRRQATPGLPGEARPEVASEGRGAGSARFSMYVVIREFAGEQLDALEEREASVARRDAYFVREGRAWASRALEHGGRERMLRLAVEQENLLSVARDTLEAAAAHRGGTGSRLAPAAHPPSRERAEQALDALVSLSVAPVLTHTSAAQLEGLIGATLELVAPRAAGPSASPAMEPPSPLVLRARLALARAMLSTGKPAAALTVAEAVLSSAAGSGGAALEVEALLLVGELLHTRGQFDRALEVLTRGLRLAHEAALRGLEARLEMTNGAALANMLRLDEAREALLRARAIAREVGDELTEGVVLRLLGHIASEDGRTEEAKVHLELGLELARQLGDKALESTCLSDLGWVLAQDGQLEAAAELCARALQCFRDQGNRWREANGLANVGVAQFWLGRLPEAERLLEAAIRIFRPLAAHRPLARIGGRLAAVLAAAGEVDRAADALEEARGHVEADGDPDRRLLLGLDEAYVLAARCARARASGDFAAAYAHLRAAEARLAAASVPTGSRRALVERSDDARLVSRHLRAHLAALALQPTAFVVGDDFQAFVTPTGIRGVIGAKPTLRALLGHLVGARRERPGEPVPWQELFAAGWPAEGVSPKVAKNRLYVALATLRGLGLKDLIQTSDGGWLLDPSVEVSIVANDLL